MQFLHFVQKVHKMKLFFIFLFLIALKETSVKIFFVDII